MLGIRLSHLIVRALIGPGEALTVAVDDTLFKRAGKRVFGAAWQHDGAAKGPRQVGRGTCFVVVAIVVELPFCSRPVALPVLARLHRPGTGPSKVEQAATMIRWLAACHHGRGISRIRAPPERTRGSADAGSEPATTSCPVARTGVRRR